MPGVAELAAVCGRGLTALCWALGLHWQHCECELDATSTGEWWGVVEKREGEERLVCGTHRPPPRAAWGILQQPLSMACCGGW